MYFVIFVNTLRSKWRTSTLVQVVFRDKNCEKIII